MDGFLRGAQCLATLVHRKLGTLDRSMSVPAA